MNIFPVHLDLLDHDYDGPIPWQNLKPGDLASEIVSLSVAILHLQVGGPFPSRLRL